MLPSITETPNELTRNIDIAGPLGIVRLFRQTDSQIYNGYLDFPGLCDQQIMETIEDTIHRTRKVISTKGKKVLIISGAGTSGRLAMLIAKNFNQHHIKEPLIKYLMAGGNKALIAAQEGSEDDPIQAVKDLEAAIGNSQCIGYFGVTCGFSAPYVAGQLDYLNKKFTQNKLKGFACLIGFNPLERSRNVPIENWKKTFLQVVNEIQKNKDCIILNPVVGPEPITGSTRMKSGSATKLLLEVIFNQALKSSIGIKESKTEVLLRNYENTRISVYRDERNLSELVNLGGATLRNKGHIYYLGKDPYGILGLVDASECPPTYGADFEDIRGFLEGGWSKLLGKGIDLSSYGSLYRISIEEFIRTKLPNLRPSDLVVVLGEGDSSKLLKAKLSPNTTFESILKKTKEKKTKTVLISIQNKLILPPKFKFLDLSLTPAIPYPTEYKEYGMKLIINALTSGAHILAGKVYQNRMIDLKISNNKLYFRTIKIVADIVMVADQKAQESVLKAIYDTDKLSPEILKQKVSEHIEAATGKEKVVPKALLLATGKFNIQSATQAIKKEPIIRNIIQEWVK